MIISEKPWSKLVDVKEVEEGVFQVTEVINLSHPECPIVRIDEPDEAIEAGKRVMNKYAKALDNLKDK